MLRKVPGRSKWVSRRYISCGTHYMTPTLLFLLFESKDLHPYPIQWFHSRDSRIFTFLGFSNRSGREMKMFLRWLLVSLLSPYIKEEVTGEKPDNLVTVNLFASLFSDPTKLTHSQTLTKTEDGTVTFSPVNRVCRNGRLQVPYRRTFRDGLLYSQETPTIRDWRNEQGVTLFLFF